ncbi:MAG: ShlB/FhaC/HecB family hemolysin secretion/activation protein [Magnetococcales bacterium]|nr:ShlB/FhaC/HecB family hemolysin secretion/activation protein [Magnetococcales bacterium]
MTDMTFKYIPAALVLSLACIASVAQAAAPATAPNIGDALRQTQPPEVPVKPAPALPAVGGVQIEAPMTALPTGPKVAVKQLEIVGNRVIDSDTLLALVADGTGQSLSLPELDALAVRITKHYRANGYFVARAYIPAQEVSDGTIKIRVVEGNYGQFRLKNASLVHDTIVQGMLDDVKEANIVSLDTLERAMLVVNDTPGVQVTRADVLPGAVVGTSDFAVETKATAPYTGYLMLDNYGSVYTGKNRMSFGADANSVTGHGDRLSLSGMGSDAWGQVNGRLGYALPLAANGLRGEVAYSQTHYQLGNTYSSLDATGTAKGVDATLTYPLRRTMAQSIETNLNVAYKDMEDKIQLTHTTTPKTSAAITGGILLRDEAMLLGSFGKTQAGLNLTYGSLSIDDPAARALDAAGAQTRGGYNKLVANLSRVSLLPADFTLTASLKVQHTLGNKNLDSSERMAVSGSSGVMAYPSGELIGSDATLARLELSRPLPALDALRSNWLVFTDWGNAKAAKPLPTDVDRHISDVGIGLTANYSGAVLRTYLAHRLEDAVPVSEPFPRDKFLVQVGWVF